MKFKVGDRVRLTREAIYSPPEETDKDISHLMEGDTVVEINDRGIILSYKNYTTYNPDLFELVPEKPEFEYGEEVEVSNDGNNWYKKIYISVVPFDVEKKYITIIKDDFEDFVKRGYNESLTSWKYARKHKPQLTRKEIAEKFGVSEDFTLIE